MLSQSPPSDFLFSLILPATWDQHFVRGCGMPKFTVELDFHGTYSTEVEAETAAKAKQMAEYELERDNDLGDTQLRKIESLQIYDESMNLCEVNE